MKTKETRRKMSESAKARCDEKWRENQSAKKRSVIPDEEEFKRLHLEGWTQVRLSSHFGLGRKVISNAIKRLGLVPHKAAKRNQQGPLNDNWKGTSANLTSKHRRLYRAFGQPSKCDVCGTTKDGLSYDWANLTGDYDDPSDFKRMCRSCHSKYDKKHLNLRKK